MSQAFYNSDYGVYGCINAGLMRLAPGKLPQRCCSVLH